MRVETKQKTVVLDGTVKPIISKGQLENFSINSDTTTYGIPFNFYSIMFYPFNAYARTETSPTIVPLVEVWHSLLWCLQAATYWPQKSRIRVQSAVECLKSIDL